MASVVIGLTGAFGSGCSTAGMRLRDRRRFRLLRLSQSLRDTWKKSHPHAEEPSRHELQRLGDEMRKEQGSYILVDLVLASVAGSPERLVIDGIRNVGEIQRLRDLYGYRFTLVAVLSSTEARWERIGSSAYLSKGLNDIQFLQDDARDRNEETPWGQQVELCIDQADLFVDNSDDVTLKKFTEETLAIVDLATGEKVRPASQQEILMHMAYGSSHSSKCLKRHVGAIVVDPSGQVVGVGYNENPLMTKPCVEEPTYGFRCFRDIIRNNHFAKLNAIEARCPICSQPLPVIAGPPWQCPSCTERGVKTNLEAFFFPDRAMNWCTAIHAEAWALTAAGERARGGTLYTTTFPCLQCAEKISQAGIREIWFTEAYPDPHSIERLSIGNVRANRFQGVRSASFERIFALTKPK